MALSFPRIEEAIEACAKHLDAAGARNTEIEAYLTRYLVTLMYAEFETHVLKVLFERGEQVGDPHVASFVRAASQKLVRGLKISDLSGLLASFHVDCKSKFTSRVTSTPAHAAYDNIVVNRHVTAHGPGATLTFVELEAAYTASLEILEAFREALNP